MRIDPTVENFKKELEEFVEEAKANPDKQYTLIIAVAGHGYHADGF